MKQSIAQFHYGIRLKQLVDNSAHTASSIAKKMGYSDRASLYDVFKKEWIKRDVLHKALDALGIDENEFFGEQLANEAKESAAAYNPMKKRFLEERIDDLENELKILKSKLDLFLETTKH